MLASVSERCSDRVGSMSVKEELFHSLHFMHCVTLLIHLPYFALLLCTYLTLQMGAAFRERYVLLLLTEGGRGGGPGGQNACKHFVVVAF